MKFLSVAILAALTEAASASKPLSSENLNAMFHSGKLDTKTLLNSAVPYRNGAFRKLEQENGNNYDNGNYYNMYGSLGQGGINGDYSVSFNTCVSLTVEEDWEDIENFENLASYIQAEQIQSVRNYILFNVCETMGDCSNPSITEQNTYVVDLNTWVEAMMNYLPDQKDSYCEGCENQQEYCNYYGVSNLEQDIDYSKAAFFYDDIKFQLIDCSQCWKYRCFDEDGDAYEQNGWDDVAEWINEISQCQESESEWMDSKLYGGFMCNQYGTGVELAVFVDDECTLYNSQKAYRNIIGDGEDSWTYYGKSQQIMNFLFNYQLDCYGGDMIYVNGFQQVYGNNGQYGYDPCAYDQTTGYYLNQEWCEEELNNNPCYVTYDDNGDMDEVDEEECGQFMEENPCWSMPGEDVNEEYQEACYEYQEQYSHQASDSCAMLFGGAGDNGGDEENGDQGNGEDGMSAIALSSCAYNFQGWNYEQEEQEEGEDQDGNGNGNAQYYDFSYLTYDMTYEMSEIAYGACYLIDYKLKSGNSLGTTVYDPTISGQTYNYGEGDYSGDAADGNGNSYKGGSNSDSYFPTMPNTPTSFNRVVQRTRKLGPESIAAIALFAAAATFVLLLAIGRIRKKMLRDQRETLELGGQKEIPLIT